MNQENTDEEIEDSKPIPARPVIPSTKGFYVSGFVDGEGSFFASARKRPDYPTKWKFSANFSVGNKDKTTIDLCQQCIGCGQVREQKPSFYVLEITDRKYLNLLVVPFFKSYPFFSEKKAHEFEVFQKLLLRIEKHIRTSEDLEEFLSLRRDLDFYRESRATNTDEIIRKTFQPQP